MKCDIEVRIELKPGVIDAEGESVCKALKLLGFKAEKVRSVHVYVITLESKSKQSALREIDDACRRLLANPVIQDYAITLK